MGALVRDVRFAARLLVKQPGFTAAAVVSLALGIGANSALFNMFNSLLWRPLPVAAPEEIACLYTTRDDQRVSTGFSFPDYRDLRDQGDVFAGVAGHSPTLFSLRSEGREDARVYGELVTGNYFEVLGVRMQLGRSFRPEEDRTPGTHPVIVLGDRFWRRRFGADPSMVGRTITLNGQAFTVIGVAPRGFNGTYAIYFAPDLYMPVMMLGQVSPSGSSDLEDRSARFLRLNARLGPGVTVEQARAAAATIAGRLARTYPDTNRGIQAAVFREIDTRPEVEISAATNAIALIFLGLTSLVLLVACANVANLLLARAAARRREIAVRLAIGAGRRQLVRQLLAESLLLSFVAGGAGLALGAVASRLMASLSVPTDIPVVLEFHTDLRVVAFTFTLAVLAAIAFGLVPALRASRPDLVPALKGEEPVAGRRRLTLTGALVVAQVAVSLVLLVAAGLFVRSVGGARTINPGFSIDRRVVMYFNSELQGYDRKRATVFYDRLIERVRALPMVEAATFAQSVPLDFNVDFDDVVIEGRPIEPGRESVQVMSAVVDPRYFEAMETPIVKGRGFSDRDDLASPRVAVVNQTMASRFWPGREAIGGRFRIEQPDSPWIEVVGVAADGKYRQLTESPRAFFFRPLAQEFRFSRTLVVRTRSAADIGDAVAGVRREVQALDPAMPIFDIKTMDQFMERAYLGPRLAALLVGPAGLLALVIASVGLYGVMAYWVSRRMREMGIRIALGARPGDVLRLVMGQGLALTGVGLALGLAGALAVGRVVGFLLFGVSATDPIVLVGVPLALAAVAAVASFVPARRALRADPLIALRAE
jgi:predicted permease